MPRAWMLLILLAGCASPGATGPVELVAAPSEGPAPAWQVSCGDGVVCLEELEIGSRGAGAWPLAADGTLYVAYAQDGGLQLRSTRDGSTWQREDVPLKELGLEGRPVAPYLWMDPDGHLRLFFQHIEDTALVYVNSGPDVSVQELVRDVAWRRGQTWSEELAVDAVAGDHLLLRDNAWGRVSLHRLEGDGWRHRPGLPCDLQRAVNPSDLTQPAAAPDGWRIECGQWRHPDHTMQVAWNDTRIWKVPDRLDGHGCEVSRHYETPQGHITVAGRPVDSLWSVACHEAVVAIGGHVLPAAGWGTWRYAQREVQPASVAIDGAGNLHLGVAEVERNGVCAGCMRSAFHLFGFSPEGNVLYQHTVAPSLGEMDAPYACGSTAYADGAFHVCSGPRLMWWFTAP